MSVNLKLKQGAEKYHQNLKLRLVDPAQMINAIGWINLKKEGCDNERF